MSGQRQTIAILLLAALAVGLVFCACDRNKEMSNMVIVQNDIFTVTGDSIIEDTICAWVPESHNRIASNITLARLDTLYGKIDSTRVKFVQGKTWRKRSTHPTMMPKYKSNQPLVDALYDMSSEYIVDGIDRNGRFVAQHNLSRLYCAIYLSLAWLKPHQSMSTLRDMVDRDTIIMQRESQWPVVNDHVGWATAAWEVYKSTGDLEWLSFCYRAVKKTLQINRQILLDQTTGLVHGVGYTSSKPLGARRLTWMDYNDLFACMSLGNNILTGNAYALLGDMCEELGIENDYQQDAKRIKDGINQHLWNEEHGMYSSFLYGMAYPQQSPLTDNTSQAMCVLWGIADDDRAEHLISHTPVSNCGVNVTYPPSVPIEPYFINSSWATTQALWNLAAADIGNENALRHGLGALYRAQALYQSRGIHIKGIDIDNLGTSASNAAMTLRVLLGINLKAEGIEFSPIVPTGMDGKKTLKGMNYRRAVLDITVEGTGNVIKTITDNGKPLEGAFLPHDVEGKHHIVITLETSSSSSNKVTIHHNEVIMPPTPSVEWTNDSGKIIDYVPGLHYILMSNGKMTALHDSVFALTQPDEFTEWAVAIAGRYGNGYMSQPHFDFNLTPQTAFFPDSIDGHTTIRVSVAQGGDYFLDIGYRPTGTLDVREVKANGHLMGTIVMTAINQLQTDELVYSNMISVKLLKGENAITFRQIRLPKSFTPCNPFIVRIIKK